MNAPIPASWPQAITSIADLHTLIAALVKEGRCFHFDDDPADTVRDMAGTRTFTDPEAAHLRQLVADCDAIGGIWTLIENEPSRAIAKLLGIDGPDEEAPASVVISAPVEGKTTPSSYSLCEAVADIAMNLALAPRHPEDSRETISLAIEWAEAFEAKNKDREWDGEYIEEIDAYFAACYAAWEKSGARSITNPFLRDGGGK